MRFHVSLEEMVQNEDLTTDNLSPRVRNLYWLNKYKLIFYVRHERGEGEKRKGTEPTPGEKKIMQFLAEKRIRYVYEPKYATIERGGNIHIRYPDFYLPDFDMVIEYDGSKKASAKKRYAEKKRAYLGNDVNSVVIESWEMESDAVWKSKLFGIIENQKLLKEVRETGEREDEGVRVMPKMGCKEAVFRIALLFGMAYLLYNSCTTYTASSATYSNKR